jgi:DHA2 family multidrug resistance protein
MATSVLPTGATGAPLASMAAVLDDPYKNKYLIAIAVTLAAVLELVDTSIVNVAIPHMMGTLGATLDEIAWVSTSYIIANVIVIPMSSWLSSYFGRRNYLTGSIAIFVMASFFAVRRHRCGGSSSGA